MHHRPHCFAPALTTIPPPPPLPLPRPPCPAQQVLQLEDCANVWWLRFALDHWCTTLAVGTNTGKVLVFDPHAPQVGCSCCRCWCCLRCCLSFML